MKLDYVAQKIIWPAKGTYVLAVSGGVDSVVLFDLFAHEAESRNYQLVIAHFDHGMRTESVADAKFAEGLAGKYKHPYESGRGALAGQPEARARTARYDFLEGVKNKHHAVSIITAHHADDEIETVIFNTLRGSNIFGQTGFSEQGNVLRPLKNVTKAEITAYAGSKQLQWREDASNGDPKYARNFVRNQFLPAVHRRNPGFDREFNILQKEVMQSGSKLQLLITAALDGKILAEQDKLTIDRDIINSFSELARCYLLHNLATRLDPNVEIKSKTLHEAARFIIAAKNGQKIHLASGLRLHISRDKVCLQQAQPAQMPNHEVKQRAA